MTESCISQAPRTWLPCLSHPPEAPLSLTSLHGCEDFSTPQLTGGSPFMIRVSTGSRQTQHGLTLECLSMTTIALAILLIIFPLTTTPIAIYLAFCKLHNRHIEPTPETLSFMWFFMCHHINPWSMSAYLSGICNTLEPHFKTYGSMAPPM